MRGLRVTQPVRLRPSHQLAVGCLYVLKRVRGVRKLTACFTGVIITFEQHVFKNNCTSWCKRRLHPLMSGIARRQDDSVSSSRGIAGVLGAVDRVNVQGEVQRS
jgi:hypothetical protein